MARLLLKLIGFVLAIGLPTCWLYYFWIQNAAMEMVRVVLPWPSPSDILATLPEAMVVAAMLGVVLGAVGAFVLFGGSRKTGRTKQRRQVDSLRRQLAETQAEADVLRSKTKTPATASVDITLGAIGTEKPSPD